MNALLGLRTELNKGWRMVFQIHASCTIFAKINGSRSLVCLSVMHVSQSRLFSQTCLTELIFFKAKKAAKYRFVYIILML